MMENMTMDPVLASALLTKLQAMQSQSYVTHPESGACHVNYVCPSSSLDDMHLSDHALLAQQTFFHSMGHPFLPPSSSALSPQDAGTAVADYFFGTPTFPCVYCKRDEKEEEGELALASSLPSCDALSAGASTRHSLLSTNDTHDSSYSVQLLPYGSGGGGGSGHYSPDFSSSYNTPLAEHVQCSIDPSPSSGRYSSQPTYLASEGFSSLLKQGMKDEVISCLGMDMQDNNVKEASKDTLSCIMNGGNPHRALSASSSSTATSVPTSTAFKNIHQNLQASWMAFNDDSLRATNPTNHIHSLEKLLHSMSNNIVTNGDHNGVVDASIKTPPERKKKRKRKRTSHKNVQEMESQRMTHIAVERNRRKQMNEHLRALRLLMPHSYIQRGDQASIVGGTIRFVEELQQVLQALRLQKQIRGHQEYQLMKDQFDDVFRTHTGQLHKDVDSHADESYASTRSCMAYVQVSMMTCSMIFVKVLAQKKPHQLLHTLLSLSNLSLKVKNLNVTTTELIVVFNFNLEMENDCQLQTSNEIAESIQQIFCM